MQYHGAGNRELPQNLLEALHNRTANHVRECTDSWTVIVVNHAACLAAILSNRWDVAFTRLADYVLQINQVIPSLPCLSASVGIP